MAQQTETKAKAGAAIIPVTPFQQNCTLLWCEATRKAVVIDPGGDVPDILAACDALAAPTRYEPYGLGVHEALCCGLPSIVSADSGVAERFTPELSGLLLHDPDSPAELVERLDRWRGQRDAFQAATLALSATLRRRTWDVMADEILALLV